jgi:hypothetical protein
LPQDIEVADIGNVEGVLKGFDAVVGGATAMELRHVGADGEGLLRARRGTAHKRWDPVLLRRGGFRHGDGAGGRTGATRDDEAHIGCVVENVDCGGGGITGQRNPCVGGRRPDRWHEDDAGRRNRG